MVNSTLTKIVLLSAALIGASGLMVGGARAQPASTYQMSCTHIGAAGSTLFADCRRMDGSFKRTSIAIPGIANINGGLRFNGMGSPSTFQDSCSNVSVAGSTLSARCRRIDGSFKRTSIAIPGIDNINGDLRYH
jgi:hypothetical protein